MTYWQNVQSAAGMAGQYHWVLLASIAAAFALTAAVPQSRRRLRVAIVLVALSAVGMLLCGFLLDRGVSDGAAGYRGVHFVSQLLLATSVVNLAGVFIFRVALGAVRLRPAPILHDTLLGVAYVVAALILLSRHGVNLSGIVATSAVVTAVIGFSLQDTLGNVMGGVALQMERSIAEGDWIKVGDVEGLVREVRWRQTSVETRNWDTVVIPNSVLMKSQVTVLGRRQGSPKLHRMWVHFNVDFRHPPAEVIDAVERALQADPIPNVAATPAPNCILNEFKESYGAYAVRYWLRDFDKDSPTSSEVRTRIYVSLQRAGISLSIPAQSVFMTMEGRGRDERKQQRELARRVAALKRVSLLEPLTVAERERLAAELTVAPFRRGEAITRQGNEAHYLYVITKGHAEVSVAVEAERRVVARLAEGDVFGEMGMMTGEPRTASVTALSDVVCYRLDKSSFDGIIQSRPEIAEAISHLLARRKVELDALTENLTAEAKRRRVADVQGDLLARIKRFFAIG